MAEKKTADRSEMLRKIQEINKKAAPNESKKTAEPKKKVNGNVIEVKFKKLHEQAEIPTYAHVDKNGNNEGDIGMDMKAVSVEYDKSIDTYLYHTGLSFETDKHYGMFLFPRSLNRNKDVYLANSVGVADVAIYRGEIIFCYKDRKSAYERSYINGMNAFMHCLKTTSIWSWILPYKVIKKALKKFEEARELTNEMLCNLEYAPYNVGDKVGQMVIIPYPDVKLIESKELSATSRGSDGFGKSGK